MAYLLLIIGFVLLIKGSSVAIDSLSLLAKKFGIPSIIVGLVLLALGTSAPELGVSIASSLNGKNDMAISNILGSNIFNILMVIGVTCLISNLTISKKDTKRDYIVTLSASILLPLLIFTNILGGDKLSLSRLDGIVLILVCILYLSRLIIVSIKNKSSVEEDPTTVKNIKILPNIIKIIIGFTAIALGADYVVKQASIIGSNWGLSQKFLGLCISSIGTSLPELVASITSLRKGENEMALGNVLGSCIFNILLIGGLSATISPITISASLLVDFIIAIASVILMGLLIFIRKNDTVIFKKSHGILLSSLYIIYMAYIVIRG